MFLITQFVLIYYFFYYIDITFYFVKSIYGQSSVFEFLYEKAFFAFLTLVA